MLYNPFLFYNKCYKIGDITLYIRESKQVPPALPVLEERIKPLEELRRKALEARTHFNRGTYPIKY